MTATTSDINNFGDYLTSQYGILLNVLNNLKTTGLVRVRNVSRAWKTAVEVIVKERRRIHCACFIPSENPEDEIVSDAEAEIKFYNFDSYVPDPSLKSLRADVMCDFQPNYGVILKDSENFRWFRCRPFPLSNDEHRFHVSVRFPPWEGVTVHCIRNNCKTTLTETEMRSLLNLPVDIKIQAVLLLSWENNDDEQTERTENNVQTAIKCLRDGYGQFALAGCKLDSQNNHDFMNIIIFAGANVIAASSVLNDSAQRDIFTKVEKFSQSFDETKNGVLFMFRCCGRDKLKRRYNYSGSLASIESQAVTKYFEQSHCVGCYSVGEYGIDFPELDLGRKKPRQELISDFEFAFSTVLLYIGYKK